MHEAMTIHRLLEYNPHSSPSGEASRGGFVRNREQPLDLDMLVVDEASMVDAQLFRAVLDALPASAQRCILVGDVDQLPSVGAGARCSPTRSRRRRRR